MSKHRENSEKTNPLNTADRQKKHAAPELPRRKGDGSGGKPLPNPKGVKRLGGG